MATILQLGTGGQLDFRTVSDKLNTPKNLYSLGTRIGDVLPTTFPDNFYSFVYLRFGDPTLPFTCTSAAQFVATNITCHGTPVFSTNVGWITFPSAPYPVTNGVLITNATVAVNSSSTPRSGTVTVTVTQPLDSYIITTTIEQAGAEPLYEAISLGFDVSQGNTAACNDFVFAPSTFFINPEANGSFFAATGLKKTASGTTGASGGWYSNGSVARFWSGTSFTSQQTCTI
jgi:hypothetical protein